MKTEKPVQKLNSLNRAGEAKETRIHEIGDTGSTLFPYLEATEKRGEGLLQEKIRRFLQCHYERTVAQWLW